MTKRIFRTIFAVATGVFLASVILFLGVLYDYFSSVQRIQLKNQTELAAQGVAHEGISYFYGLGEQNCRLTWISSDGSVLYDSKGDAADMENHLEREEIKEAFSSGYGESARHSATMLERYLYSAKRLPDGTVLRLSVTQNTLFTLTMGMMQPVCVILVAAVVVSLILASRLSKKIVKPFNDLDLDHPLKNDGYDELSPLLRRIDAQQKEIQHQKNVLEQKQHEFEVLTSSMAEGLVLLNQKGVILSINPAAERLFQADASCIGNDILSVNRTLGLAALLEQAGRGECSESVEDLAGGKYQIEANPVFSGGAVSGVVLLLLDVTEKEKSEQLRREFTANVSHELKTPLHTISGSAELMANGMVKPEDVPDFAKRMYAEAQRMIRLVEDIIRLSRLDEGAEEMSRSNVDLFVIADDTVRELCHEAENSGIQMSLQGESSVLFGIPQLLGSIVYNLCENAIKYNSRGGSVSVEVWDKGNFVLLSVSDTGIGIPAEYQKRIFERFFRIDKSHSKEIGGTGLGLSIVKHAARLHGAEIDLQSAVNEGTTVSVKFPKKQDTMSAENGQISEK